jgi:hypothetical protein
VFGSEHAEVDTKDMVFTSHSWPAMVEFGAVALGLFFLAVRLMLRR